MNTKKKKLKDQVIAIFIRQLALVLDSDLPIHSGLEVIKSKTKLSEMSVIIDEIQKSMKSGRSLSESMNAFEVEFTPFVVNMIELGETSGHMIGTLNQIADTLEKSLEIKSKVKASLSYPIILSLLMLGVIALLVVKVLPIFKEILSSSGGEMPFFTEVMMDVSKFLGSNILYILAVIIVIIITFILIKRTDKGRYFFDKLKFHMPIQKEIVAAVMGTTFSRNLSVLLKSGFSFSIAMEMLKPIMNNRYMSTLLDHSIVQLKDGKPLSDVIENFNIFPGVMIKLFSVAQQTGHMEKMLDKVADEMQKEADMRLDSIATVIEPMLIIILSILVGIILISVILPIINILNAIG